MKLLLNGVGGFMGGEVVRATLRGYGDAALVGGIEPFGKPDVAFPVAASWEEAKEIFPQNTADCLIDFSNHVCTKDLLDFAVGAKIPLVIATTGHTQEELALIKEAAKEIPIFHSANMSVGVALLVKLAKTAAAAMPDADIEIIEKHHNRKVDAPSGTAMMLYREIATVRENAPAKLGRSGSDKRNPGEIGLHAVRMGNIVGEHEVILCTPTQSITLKHEAYDRALFAEGAIVAANFVKDQKAGLYDMHHMLNER